MDEQQQPLQHDQMQQPEQQPQQPQPSEQPQQQQPAQKPKNDGMGWYKFLIYFALFAGAAWNFIYGILYVTGYVYDIAEGSGAADIVYWVFPNLQTADILFGIACMALAAYAIVVRFLLAKLKKCSLICLYLLYGIVIIMEVIYLAVAANIINASIGDVLDGQTVAYLIWQFVFLIGSVVYFSKHKDMFVH